MPDIVPGILVVVRVRAETVLIEQLEEEFRYLTRKNRIEMRLTRERVRKGALIVC